MRVKRTQRIWSLLAVIVFTTAIEAHAYFDPDAYIFSYLTSENGLAQNTVDYIYKDSRGFMWFATWNGLNRYDGYKFIHYHTQPKKNAINSLFVKALIEDDFHRLWAGTENGVNMIDIYSEDVLLSENFQFSENNIFKVSVNTLLKDKKGRIWVGLDKGLAVVSFNEQGEIISIDTLQEDVKINALHVDNSGKIWIGYDKGIKIVNELPNKDISVEKEAITSEIQSEVFAFCQDGNELWIGTSFGLYRYDTLSKTYIFYTHDADNPHSIIQNYVMDIAKDNDGNIFIATYKGLSVYNRDRNDFTNISYTPEDSHRLNNNFVNSLYIDDSQGIIWVGTEKGGVNKIRKKRIMFEGYQHNAQQSSSLSPYPVNAIFEDSNQNLWIGTVEGGLNKRIGDSDQFIHYKNDPNVPHSLPHNVVSVITEGNGYLWIGSWGGGIFRMKLSEEGRFTLLEDLVDKGSHDYSFVSAITFDKKLNALWIAARSGLYLYDLHSNRLSPVLRENQPINAVSALLLDNSDRLWIGSDNGLFCLHIDSSDTSHMQFNIEYCPLTSQKETLQHNKISCIFNSKDNILWIGSNGKALYQLTEREGDRHIFKNYGTDAGISDNVIYAIEEDKHGNLWLSTNTGLSCFYPEKACATTFYTSDGLSSNQFYWSASCHTSDGKILFGNVKGAVIFDPSETVEDTTALAVSVIAGRRLNEPIDIRDLMNEWKLKETDHFSIEFSSLYYISSEKIRYSYTLEGFDKDWTTVDADRRLVSYSNLPSGNYAFKVKSTNPGGEWSDKITTLYININLPFYRQKWFIGLSLLSVVLLLTYLNYPTIKRLLRKKKQVEKKSVEPAEKTQSNSCSAIEKSIAIELPSSKKVQDQEFPEKIKKVLEENYQNTTFDIAILTEKMKMSKSLLHKKLHSSFGQPAVKIIRIFRLTKAKELIESKKGGKMNISEIAYEVGFNDPKYFTRCFTKYFGVTPSKYLEDLKNKDNCINQ